MDNFRAATAVPYDMNLILCLFVKWINQVLRFLNRYN